MATFSGRSLAIHDVRRGQLKYRTSFKENHTIVDVDFLQLTSMKEELFLFSVPSICDLDLISLQTHSFEKKTG